MTNQEKWIDFCEKNDSEICIFDKPFWLDAVCGGRENWDVFLVEEKEQIQAALPYYKKKRRGLRYITMPPLTQYNGIWLKPVESEKTEKRINGENKMYKLLIEQIEAQGSFFYQQCFSPEVKNWQPFYWAGYRQKTLYTFWINGKAGLEEVERNFSKSTRANLRMAGQAATIGEFDDIALFYKVNSMTFARQNKENHVSLALVERVYRACRENGAAKMLCAKDGDGQICSVVLFVYDAKNVYSILAGTVPEKRQLNFQTVLTYEGIKFALSSGRNYDFEGSMLEGVANSLLRFGAEMRPYYLIKKVLVKTPILSQYLKYRLYYKMEINK